ncbi:synaptotagmin-16 isoform X2 [Cynoglossus semilaevis]|uniref:synaptotagmin-16 isoform X2 n=1 Tax=Cynoglossus semilaevis TaxID=244447 RepID=UPI0007DCAFB0|nr:synaptotagmin-16 isoform X2 [Cynoglossus semilaevis]
MDFLGENQTEPSSTLNKPGDSCLFVWSDQCVIVCPLSLSLLPPVTPEAIGFLSAVGVFIVALAVLFLFINKKFCFSRVGGLPCLEEHGRRRRGKPGIRQGLVNSYGATDEDEDDLTSSDSGDEVLKQFEISVSRSQSFRCATPAAAPAAVGEDEQRSQKAQHSLGRRHKFTRLSEQEEGSTEPSDCEEMEAPRQQSFKDPLTAALEESERAPSSISRDQPSVVSVASVVSETSSVVRDSPTLSMRRQAADGSEDTEHAAGDHEQNNPATDSSSTWSPEEQPPQDLVSSQPVASSLPSPISRCGDLVVTLEYRLHTEKLLVTVIEAKNVPDKARSGMDSWQIHMVLLPAKKQRHKTTVQKGSQPHFNETFRFSRLEPSDLSVSAIRFRLYALGGRMSRERMMGEKVLRLGDVAAEGGQMKTSLILEPRSNLKSMGSVLSLSAVSQTDSITSTRSLAHGGAPELLIGLSYNATTGRMSVELIKGSHFRNLAIARPPDTYARLTLLNSVGQEISRCKTSVRRGQPNPVYKETFIFQVALFQLSDVTLLTSIYNRRSMKRKEMVGWFALGQNSSGEEEQLHWQDMKESGGQQVCRWHVLLEA